MIGGWDKRGVLLDRKRIVSSWREKEWWFSYAFDSRTRIYLGWFVFRTYLTDHINLICFDLDSGQSYHFERHIMLAPEGSESGLDLRFSNRLIAFSYKGSPDGRRHFEFRGEGWNIDLATVPGKLQSFTRRDDLFVNRYRLIHRFGDRVRGFLTVGDRRFDINTDVTYYDHCAGRLPRTTSWHWLAVTGRAGSLTTLVNYGTHPQCYTQFNDGRSWIRLSPAVSFDYDRLSITEPWRITSTELDLVIHPLAVNEKVTHIPPFIPFLLKTVHHEMPVRAEGRILTDGRWRAVKDLLGVLERHDGTW